MPPIEMEGQTVRYRRDPGRTAGGRRPMADPTIRASDAERAEVADNLSRHFADGRLDQPEFKRRLDQAMEATTRGDLDGLFDDLPRLPSEPSVEPEHRRRIGLRLVPLMAIVAVLSLVVLASRPEHDWFHVPWVLFVVAGFLLWRRARHHRPVGHRRSELEP
ncbi:MAG TPA: DUF1707 domain-containing protein [Acidimicrobiales bacterium]